MKIRWHPTPFIGGGQSPSRWYQKGGKRRDSNPRITFLPIARWDGSPYLLATLPNWRMACGNRDIRNIVSACTVWFTFVFRTPIPRAVGSSEQGLTRSRGHPCHWVALPSPFVLLLYHRPFGLSRVFLIFFEERVGIRTHQAQPPALPQARFRHHREALSFVPLLYHNLGDLSSLIFCREDT